MRPNLPAEQFPSPQRTGPNSQTSLLEGFHPLWEEIKNIPGWLTEVEALHLYAHALKVAPNHIIVEIGSFCGRSATLFAHTGLQVITIDPMTPSTDYDNCLTITELEAITLRQNVAKYPNITWIRARSDEVEASMLQAAKVPSPALPIGLLYIDANHQYPNPLNDFNHFQSGLTKNSYVAFHDYGSNFPGVKRSVDEIGDLLLPGIQVGSMYITQIR